MAAISRILYGRLREFLRIPLALSVASDAEKVNKQEKLTFGEFGQEFGNPM